MPRLCCGNSKGGGRMTVTKEIIAAKVEEMAKLSKEKATLDLRYKELEAFFLKLGGEKLRDSKRRTCTFDDNDGHDVTYTEARTVKIISPAVLKRLMGDAFGDYIKESLEPKYTFKSKELERTFASVYSADIAVPERKLTVDEFYDQLPCDDSAKSALRKKLKGANFLTDCKNLVSIGGFSDEDAADYAYLFSECLEWQRFMTVLDTIESKRTVEEVIRAINSAISVSDTTKITV